MTKENKKMVHMVAFVLAMVGALNWGLVGLLNVNVVSMLVGSWPMVEKLVYLLVGLSAIYLVGMHMEDCRWCGSKK